VNASFHTFEHMSAALASSTAASFLELRVSTRIFQSTMFDSILGKLASLAGMQSSCTHLVACALN